MFLRVVREGKAIMSFNVEGDVQVFYLPEATEFSVLGMQDV